MRSIDPLWVRHAMWWHVYPLGFVGAPQTLPPAEQPVIHRIDRIEAWLDHVQQLGLNGLQLGPVFASSTHGYDTVDYFRIDPRLGDENDLVRLIGHARDRGIRVLLDGVFNHVGREHPLFRALQEQGPDADSADLFRVNWDGWHEGDTVDADVFEGHEQLVALRHDSPRVVDLVVDVMTYWLDRGIDGWRLDAAYAVPPSFWAAVLPRVRERHPDAWFTGEVIHGDQAAIVRESTINSLTQYELWQGIWHSIADRNLHELAHAVRRHTALLTTMVPSTFVGNHDVTRVATAVGDAFVPHALAVLFTVAGTPAIYAGDEYGYHAVKEERFGGDDAIRPEFPASPPAVETLDPWAADTLHLTEAMIALRRQRPWLHEAATDVVEVDNGSIVLRTATPDGSVVCALNLAATPVTVSAAGARTVLIGQGDLGDSTLTLPPQGWVIAE
ncbi:MULTISPECIES: alpha-amylase family glycosyl hydrolase [unclassified Microbacterium]|uniref:alpha-amylase family glycosyl hydrolase n=1 Tax=unclassified Microbacterium TaxID=2609290 RepID=UPI00214ADEF3|nr:MULTISPECIES: alpha-amylase family glycosyl hydrolase [unclassified Microbacterium]MCR2785932.1 alpha-amylase family glycosyl hydrolase [Microbacterium sp. zg.B96]WIM17094.1 alpha-amylase family glycosyl hydrolase [Microbacterium sp. zg-B96]